MTFSDGARRRAAAVAQVFVEDLAAPALCDDDAHHLLRVRRLRDGEEVIAADGAGSWRRCEVAASQLVVIGDIEREPEVDPVLTVAFAPVKGDRSEWAVGKLTELGCDRIVALATERGSIRWSPSAASRALERWTRVAREAACQARRVRLPLLEGPLSPAELSLGAGVALGVPGGAPLEATTRTVLIGPEGGWSDAELDLGLPELGLGAHVLRTETAAVAAGVLLGGRRAGTVGDVETRAKS